MICIKSNLLRSNKDLYFDPVSNKSFLDCDQLSFDEKDLWIFDAEFLVNENCFRTISKLFGQEIEDMFVAYDKIYRSIYKRKVSCNDIPIVKYKSLINELLSKVKFVWDNSEIDRKYYVDCFKPKMKFLSSMEKACIDQKSYEDLCDSNSVDKTVLASFVPNSDGFANKVEYSALETKTGRLVVNNGPNINILPKMARNILRSRWKDGCIVSVDYSSVEMQVLLVENNQEPKTDVYSDFSNSYNLNLPRDISKKALISAVYGAGSSLVSSMVGSKEKGQEIFENAKLYLQTESLERRLKEECNKNNGIFFNRFGRRLSDLTNLINGFAQSTAVDVCINGFENLTNIMQINGLSFRKLFVLHDAIFFDLESEKDYLQLCKICDEKIESFGIKYPIKVEKL